MPCQEFIAQDLPQKNQVSKRGRWGFFQAVIIRGNIRPRADEAHLALENVPELGNLVELPTP